MRKPTLKPIDAADLAIPGADPWFAKPDDPAISVMTDFRMRASVTVDWMATVDAALEHMKHAGVRCSFVTNEARRVVALATAHDLMGEKPMRFVQTLAGQRQDVRVRDIAVFLRDWRAVDVGELERVTVDSVRQVMEEAKLTHLPVIETVKSGQQLRGLLSAAKIRRLLSR